MTGYLVERCAGAGCTTFAQIGDARRRASTTPASAASTSYSYRVRATDAATQSQRVFGDRHRHDAGSPVPITFVQRNYAVPQPRRRSVAVPYTAAQTAGDLNLVVVGWNDATAHVLSVTDTDGNAYTRPSGRRCSRGSVAEHVLRAEHRGRRGQREYGHGDLRCGRGLRRRPDCGVSRHRPESTRSTGPSRRRAPAPRAAAGR